MSDRPVGVAILAILSGLVGACVFCAGLLLCFIMIVSDVAPALFVVVAGTFLVLGVLGVTIAYGMWNGLVWARWLAIIAVGMQLYQWFIALLLVSSLDVSALSYGLIPFPQILIFGPGALGIFADVVISGYLFRSSVEDFFNDHESPLAYLTMLLFPVPFMSLVWGLTVATMWGMLFNTQGFVFCIIAVITGCILLVAPKYMPE